MQHKLHHNMHHIQQSRIAERLLPDLKRLDRFIDISLSSLDPLDATKDPGSKAIPNTGSLAIYKATMTDNVQNTLTNKLSELNRSYSVELATAQQRALDMNNQIDALFSNMNNTLLEELQKSYNRAHQINNKRQKAMQSIDDLPLKVMA